MEHTTLTAASCPGGSVVSYPCVKQRTWTRMNLIISRGDSRWGGGREGWEVWNEDAGAREGGGRVSDTDSGGCDGTLASQLESEYLGIDAVVGGDWSDGESRERLDESWRRWVIKLSCDGDDVRIFRARASAVPVQSSPPVAIHLSSTHQPSWRNTTHSRPTTARPHAARASRSAPPKTRSTSTRPQRRRTTLRARASTPSGAGATSCTATSWTRTRSTRRPARRSAIAHDTPTTRSRGIPSSPVA